MSDLSIDDYQHYEHVRRRAKEALRTKLEKVRNGEHVPELVFTPNINQIVQERVCNVRLPTAEEIEAETAAIRRKWSKKEEIERQGGLACKAAEGLLEYGTVYQNNKPLFVR